MVTISSQDLADLHRRRVRRAGIPPDCLSAVGFRIFVPGRIVNPLNQRPWNGWRQAKWTEEWKEKVAGALLAVGYRRGQFDPRAPKRVRFVAHVVKKFDGTDGLRAALKVFPDAMKDYGVLHDDRDSAGHAFVYEQLVDRACPGVEVVVELKS